MTEKCAHQWIDFNEKIPEHFPCTGRNYNLHIEDIIIGIDYDNHAFHNACFCRSLPGMSMPFTHWLPLPVAPEDKCQS